MNLYSLFALLVMFSSNLKENPTSNQSNEVTIGKQIWSARNLDVDTFRNGDKIPYTENPYEWQKPGPHMCYYENDASNNAKSGKLYNWYAVTDPRGLAPQGWHIPTIGEWQQLLNSLGGEMFAGADLKNTTAWHQYNKFNTNASGFNAVPGGYRFYDGEFTSIHSAFFWTASPFLSCQINGSTKWVVTKDNNNQKTGISIRLVKD